VLGQLEALAQHGDQDLFGEGERGRVPDGGLAGGRPAAAYVELGITPGLAGDGERA